MNIAIGTRLARLKSPTLGRRRETNAGQAAQGPTITNAFVNAGAGTVTAHAAYYVLDALMKIQAMLMNTPTGIQRKDHYGRTPWSGR